MKKIRKIASILLVLALLCAVTISNVFAQPAQVSAVAGIASNGKTFSLNQPVTISWSSLMPYGVSFKAELTDAASGKLVNRIVVTDDVLTYDRAFFKVSKSYKFTVTALADDGTKVYSQTAYFHVGKAVTNTPVNNDTLVVTGVQAAVDSGNVEMTAAPEISAAPMDDAMGSVVSAIKSSNYFFAGNNANGNSALWFNKPINSQYDAYLSSILNNSYGSSHFRFNYAFEAEVFNLVNQYRAEMGRQPLIWSDNLARVARLRVIAGSDAGMTHDIAEVGGFPVSTIANIGWKQRTIFGENIVGKASSESVDWASRANELVTMWKNSPTHNENMLDERYQYGGMAIVIGDNSFGRGLTGVWALQLFAG